MDALDSPEQVTLVVTLSYNGRAYSGFAKQKDPRVHTIQGELERALATLFRHPVETVCAGRTDAGVHALEQTITLQLDVEELACREPRKIVTSLNALTPDDLSITRVGFAAPEFSARFDAVYRVYRYRIVMGGAPPLFAREFSWWHRAPLDVAAMQEAARLLEGEHDFKSFCKAASAEGKSTCRYVESIDFFEEEVLGERCLTMQIVGNAFLHSMVRNRGDARAGGRGPQTARVGTGGPRRARQAGGRGKRTCLWAHVLACRISRGRHCSYARRSAATAP